MLWVEIQYAKMVGSQLARFKVHQSSPFVANFRCPFCGDSQRNKSKTRGYLLQRSQNVSFYCHNCGASMSFRKFLERIDPNLHKEMMLELFRGGESSTIEINDDRFKSPVPTMKLPESKGNDSILDLLVPAADHSAALQYLTERATPRAHWSEVYATDNFPAFVASAFPDKTISEPPCSRIVIPFRAPRNDQIVGVCARVIPSTATSLNRRYYSISNPGYPKLWQSPNLDTNKTVYVTEGVMDAFHVENSASMLGSDVGTDVLRSLFDDFVYVYDNEPRNKQIVEKMIRKVKEDCKIVVWPSDNSYKDVNAMVLAGVQPKLKQNTKQGLEAQMAISNWKRVD